MLTGEEVNPIIRVLRDNGIEVTAIHSHMLTEQPRLIFMHFWANDDAIKLAKGLRDALDKTARAKAKWQFFQSLPGVCHAPAKIGTRLRSSSNRSPRPT